MNSKIRIRLGTVEIEYEGEHSFLASDLLPMVEKLLALSPRSFERSARDPGSPAAQEPASTGTLNTLAAKLKVASGPELIVASLYHLSRADGRETATRQEILARMRTAASYYKATFNNNMSSYLEKLVKANKIRETAANLYSLATSTIEELEAKLAQP